MSPGIKNEQFIHVHMVSGMLLDRAYSSSKNAYKQASQLQRGILGHSLNLRAVPTTAFQFSST